MNQPDRINILVKDYLTMNTEYALLITGEWGSGNLAARNREGVGRSQARSRENDIGGIIG